MNTPRNTQTGFSVWELALWLTFLGGLASVILVGMNAFLPQARSLDQARILERADRQLQGFVAANFRLPCPDMDADGLEGTAGVCASTDTIGTYPWRTLGFKPGSDSRGVANLRYGIYRNTVANADLVLAVDLFNPTSSRNTTTAFAQINNLDMCTALNNASTAALSTAFLYVTGIANRNVAYVIADPGAKDADADGVLFDGANAAPTASLPGYDAPELALSDTNDDRTMARGFNALARSLNCDTTNDTTMRSLNTMADADLDAVGEVQTLATDIGVGAPAFWVDSPVSPAASIISQADALGLMQ